MSIRFSDWVLEHSIETEYTPYDLVEEQLVAQMDVCTAMMECYAKQCAMSVIYMESDTEKATDQATEGEAGGGEAKEKWYKRAWAKTKEIGATVGKFFKALWTWLVQQWQKAVAFVTSKNIGMLIKKIEKLKDEDKAKFIVKLPEYVGQTNKANIDKLTQWTKQYIGDEIAGTLAEGTNDTIDSLTDVRSKLEAIKSGVAEYSHVSYKEGRKGAYEKGKLKEGTAIVDFNAEKFVEALKEFQDKLSGKEVKEAMARLKRKDLMKRIVNKFNETHKNDFESDRKGDTYKNARKGLKDDKAAASALYKLFMEVGNSIRYWTSKEVTEVVGEMWKAVRAAFKALGDERGAADTAAEQAAADAAANNIINDNDGTGVTDTTEDKSGESTDEGTEE